jgi:CubicO group peptidase (beta-lactamase class C family)
MNGGREPEGLEPRRRAMRLEHLLTMASGLACDDSDGGSPGREDTMQNQDREPDWYRFALALPMAGYPGGPSRYCSAGANLAGGVTARLAGRSLLSMFERLVAQPLGIERYAVNLMPTGEAYGGGGIHIGPRDLLKVGQTMLDGGRWKGRQVLDAGWVVRATSPLKSLGDVRYGYLWWVIDLEAADGRSFRAFYAGGNGGQVLMVIPGLDVVVSFLGGNYGDPVFYVPQREFVPKYVLPMVLGNKRAD